MDNINAFLAKFKNLKDPKVDKEKIHNLLREEFSIEIEINCIETKGEVLRFRKINGATRNFIALNKESILEKVSRLLNKKIVTIIY